MKFEEFWANKRKSNSHLNDDTLLMKITVSSFRIELEKAFHAGSKTEPTMKAASNIFEDIFNEAFKGFTNKK